MTGPLVSIIIPVYNVEQYLEECLDSILNQTYKNYEIIAINDGSTDNSAKILEKYKQKYEEIIVYHQENAGISVARNKGLKLAKGKYIYFLDSDDYIVSETIENLVKKMEKYNLDLIRFAAEPFMDEIKYEKFDKSLYDYSKFFDSGRIYEKNEFLKANIKGFSPIVYLYIVKKELLINNNIYFKPGIIHEDELFSTLVYLHTNRAMYDGNFYHKRRYRADSVMTSQIKVEKAKRSFDSYLTVIEEISKLLRIYKENAERKFIKSRLYSIYIGLQTRGVESKYKKEMLKKFDGLTTIEKKYYYLHYIMKNYIKRLTRYIN
jgi:glycosyltransferase involved in cell wall biosynthesis